MKTFSLTLTTASALALAVAAPAIAQESEQSEGDSVKLLSSWTYDPIYESGWSIESMFNVTEVVDSNGEVIGDVENVIFSNEGELLGVIAEVGGFWDIGDTHVHVPWSDVMVGDDIDQIEVPVTEDTVDNFDVFGGFTGEEQIDQEDTAEVSPVNDDLVAGPSVFKATDLIGDYVYLSDDVRYGYVADILVQDEMVSAIVTDARAYGRAGYYAYPYNVNGAAPMESPRYDLPYDATEVDTLENFDYTQLQARSQ
ncbi:MAG: PRC-barrel domain-containing protein [Marivita lacus]|nr:PRC-barrel domain-containing protein [Marivita lacus]